MYIYYIRFSIQNPQHGNKTVTKLSRRFIRLLIEILAYFVNSVLEQHFYGSHIHREQHKLFCIRFNLSRLKKKKLSSKKYRNLYLHLLNSERNLGWLVDVKGDQGTSSLMNCLLFPQQNVRTNILVLLAFYVPQPNGHRLAIKTLNLKKKLPSPRCIYIAFGR